MTGVLPVGVVPYAKPGVAVTDSGVPMSARSLIVAITVSGAGGCVAVKDPNGNWRTTSCWPSAQATAAPVSGCVMVAPVQVVVDRGTTAAPRYVAALNESPSFPSAPAMGRRRSMYGPYPTSVAEVLSNVRVSVVVSPIIGVVDAGVIVAVGTGAANTVVTGATTIAEAMTSVAASARRNRCVPMWGRDLGVTGLS